MPSQTSILTIGGKPTAISQPGTADGKLRRWTGQGAGEIGGIQHTINRLFRTERELTPGERLPPHIMSIEDVTKGLGLEQTDRDKVHRIIRQTRADYGASSHLRLPRLHSARATLSTFMLRTKRFSSEVRMEIQRRAMAWWKKYGHTDYEGTPMIRHIVTKAQAESPTLLKAFGGEESVKRYAAGEAGAGGGGAGTKTAFGRMSKPAPRGGEKPKGGGGPYVGPKGGKWANPEHTIPWKGAKGGAPGAKHEEPSGEERSAGVEEAGGEAGGDGEGTELPEFKLHITGQDHAQLAARLKQGIEKGSDLCKMSPPVCHENLGILRDDMPQLDDDVLPNFLKSYQDKGVSVKKGTMEVGRLKATQSQILAETASGMAQSYKEGSFDPAKKPIIISKDGYILDGHHRWAAMVVTDPASKMRVFQVDTDINTLLKDAGSFKGVTSAKFGAKAGEREPEGPPPKPETETEKAMWMQALGAARRDQYLRE